MGIKNFLMKRLLPSRKIKKKHYGTHTTSPIQIPAHGDISTDFDSASIASGNSNLSTGTLHNIRDQMAASLERMRELEEQVKAIPMLQVQVSVLKEEKRILQRLVEGFNRTRLNDEINYRFHNNQSNNDKATIKSPCETRDMGVMCEVATRDVGISHQQVGTRDVGMVTSTPINKNIDLTILNIDENNLNKNKKKTCNNLSTKFATINDMSSLSILSKEIPKIDLKIGPMRVDNIWPNKCNSKDFSTNTDSPLIKKQILSRSDYLFEEILPTIDIKKLNTRNFGTTTDLKLNDIKTNDDIENHIKLYKNNNVIIKKNSSIKSTQCDNDEFIKKIKMKNKEIQVTEPFKMRTNVGITVKPRTCEIGTDVITPPGTRTIGIGPDPVQSIQSISLNSMNLRSHSFNYGDKNIVKKKTMKSIGIGVDNLIKTNIKSTDTSDLLPKKREFGTSPMKKKYIDVSVGDSLKSHIEISCAANYCDNCKETIKSIAKQLDNNNCFNYIDNTNKKLINDEEKINDVQNTSQIITSKIPRPSNILLNNLQDVRKQFKRQDTYTKIPTGIIRYDADNKDTYNSNNKHQQQTETTEEIHVEKKESKNISTTEHKIMLNDEKKSQPETSFEPIRDKLRIKNEPTKEMRAAIKVLNDNLKKSPNKNISNQTKNAINVIQQEWFKISSTATANPHDVEDYLDCFEEYSNYLLEHIVNMSDTSGNTAMHYAVSHGNFDVVSILLDSKVCDINKANIAGYTAVMLAALAEVKNSTHSSVANRLFQMADVNIRAKLHGQTALMLAVSHGRKDMTKLLLDAGAAINIQDEDGSTALMCAAEHGHVDIVRLLLAHTDCDSSIVDIDGSSALKIALEAGNRDIGILLYAHEHVNRGTSPFSSMRRSSRRGSKPTTPTGPSPSAPASPAPARRFHSSNASLNISKYPGK
ncbi:KN motif and ankyrin repeat domain-containing protein 2 isoform X2 [Aphidius gifuensis]|uniref:KN motif and ankyrin repeat domain-containing protein 2 isoform X2 n=1 Tax=Aphidius gifuensis TaxID=684658 RepID=UPI001CDCA25F|nr:KN motif and ankyrin repeat domain-containing protein 2 isoform X2 [Aphidius gifuensis]